MTDVYSRTVDKVTPLHVGGLRINRWEIELTVDATKHDKKDYFNIKVKSESECVKYLFLLFLSLGKVAINLKKPPWWRLLHIYVLYVIKAQCTYCWGNDTMSCNYTAVRHKTVKQWRTKREQSLYTYHYFGHTKRIKEKLPLKLVVSSVFNSERYLFFNINLILKNK